MAGDPGMAQVNALLDWLWWADIHRSGRDEDPGSAASAAAQDRYEAEMINEARAIVAGEVARTPTVEHLRVALAWLDGALLAHRSEGESPF